MTTGRLEVAADGKVTGPAKITYNDPFPTRNGSYGSGAMMGVVMHTQVGNNPGTVAWFNNPASQASAHFCVAQDGQIVQMGPIGKGWIAWAEAAGNPAWYSIEHADNTDPAIPLTVEQITASAQLVEVLSRFAGFPLQVSNSTEEKGYGTHAMGAAAWGGHTSCPGTVRAAQRQQILDLARQIRDVPDRVVHWRSMGLWSLAHEAAAHGTTPAEMIALAAKAGHVYGPAMKKYVAAGDWDKRLPAGTWLFAPER